MLPGFTEVTTVLVVAWSTVTCDDAVAADTLKLVSPE